MLIRNIFRQAIHKSTNIQTHRKFCLNQNNNENYSRLKITICGAAGHIGQLVSLFLKNSPYKLNLCLYDISPGVFELQKELEIINTNTIIDAYAGSMKLRHALKDSDIVTVLVKSNNYKRISQNETFEMNYPSVSSIAKTCIEVCPEAIFAIATNPLNTIVPAVCEIYKWNNMPYRQKVLGITSLDVMMACSIFSNVNHLNPMDVFVPITGGTTVNTIIPMFSQATPSQSNGKLFQENTTVLVNQFLKYKIMETKMPLASALSISQFLQSLIKAIQGEKDIVECAYVATDINLPCKYLISLIDLNEFGIKNVYAPPKISNHYENCAITQALNILYHELSIFNKIPLYR